MTTLIKEDFLTPGEARHLERMGFVIEQIKPIVYNEHGYKYKIGTKGE